MTAVHTGTPGGGRNRGGVAQPILIAVYGGCSRYLSELDGIDLLLARHRGMLPFCLVVIVRRCLLGASCASFVVTWRLYTAKVRNSKRDLAVRRTKTPVPVIRYNATAMPDGVTRAVLSFGSEAVSPLLTDSPDAVQKSILALLPCIALRVWTTSTC